MISQITKLVKEACKQETNFYGYGIWSHHIIHVVKYAKELAKKLKADEEVVEIAALLHDYASIKDKELSEEHHIHGAKLAEEILKKYNYPREKIEQVKQCIISHRGSKPKEKISKEALCLADADAMAHFDGIPSLFYLAFFSHKLDVDSSRDWLMKKLERSWNKISPQAKEMIKDKYEASKLLLQDSSQKN